MMQAPLEQFAIRLRLTDNVAVASRLIPVGQTLKVGDVVFQVVSRIALGHKVALAKIAPGSPVQKYGEIIGFASREIEAGEHVHTHNITADQFDRDYAFASDTPSTDVRGSP